MWDWRGYIQLAQRLAPTTFKTIDEEARSRSVLSRAYYGAYNEARHYIKAKGYRPYVPNSHDDVWNILQERERTEAEREVGDMGHALYRDRRRGDYDMEVQRLDKKVESSLADAHKICELLGRSCK